MCSKFEFELQERTKVGTLANALSFYGRRKVIFNHCSKINVIAVS